MSGRFSGGQAAAEYRDEPVQVRPSTILNNVTTGSEPATEHDTGSRSSSSAGAGALSGQLKKIYDIVSATGRYNFAQARCTVPSALHIDEWRRRLVGHGDINLADYLQYGWPINFNRLSPLCPTYHNHPSATQFEADIDHYIDTELGHGALLGPFRGPPTLNCHLSPLMTRTKKDAEHRRVIMDLSWPDGAAVNDGVDQAAYIDGPATITLPTADFMVAKILELGPGAWLYKTDLARGYRQLRVDPLDWPFLCFKHRDQWYMDICPPFGLRSSAMCMQRTTEAISYMHQKEGYCSRPYLDDFGGAEASQEVALRALTTLQGIMRDLGVKEALHKVHPPTQRLVWLGILYDTIQMRMSIPSPKMAEIMTILGEWEGRTRATRRQVQALFGLLQFVASVSPPVRIFTNRILQCLRDMPKRGAECLSLGFRQDLRFFLDLLPRYDGVRILNKADVPYQAEIELDACLTGCGATIGDQYYSEVFPLCVQNEQHIIAHLEMLNVVVALKVWCDRWRGKKVRVDCDNMVVCLALQSGRSRDPYLQHCVREVFLWVVTHDVELVAVHRPGVQLVRADALSRQHMSERHRQIVAGDRSLQKAARVRVPIEYYKLLSEL